MWNFSYVPRSANCTTLLSCDRLDDLNKPRLAPPDVEMELGKNTTIELNYKCEGNGGGGGWCIRKTTRISATRLIEQVIKTE
jgi:hypothetical protein